MASSKIIRVTPNIEKCLSELKAAVRAMPAGDAKTRARKALDYLSRTMDGEAQPMKGRGCPRETPIIR